tara:strand:- start:7366 stop:9561 length:2196 start_codon:yes stop_codon:yes gene_type:complete
MKFSLKKTLGMVMAFASILNIKEKEIPIADGKVAFTEEQLATIHAQFNPATADKAIEAINKEIAQNEEVANASSKLDEALLAYETAEEAAAKKAKEKKPNASEEEPGLNAKIEQLTTKAKEAETALAKANQNLEATVKKLMESAEDDSPLERILGQKAKEMKTHSATHLFGSGKAFDAFEGRNWNALAAGKTTSATDWTASDASNIQKLNGDAELYFRENPDVIKSLHRDNFGLPASWGKTFNVVDKITTGSITTAEITQGRKLPWLPKNKQKIQPEEGKIFPISIDIEYVGHLLSQIEASWLASMNNEGSQYDKMTFVRFLLMELDKKARLEDRQASINGVYVQTPDDATKAPSFLHRQDGLKVLIWRAREITKKFRPFNLGTPTATNIVDYVENFVKSLPYEVRKMNGIELGLSPTWIKAYGDRYEQIHATQTDYKGVMPYPKGYPNIKFQPVIDLEGSDVVYITETSNLDILENRPKEKGWYRFGSDGRRNIFIINDYKLGIRLKHIGTTVADGDPDAFKVQSIWTNNVPLFSDDFFAPVYDDETGVIKATFNQYKVDEGWKTDITNITGLAEGIIVRLQGNTSLAAAKNVKNNANLSLTGDFDLSSGGTLTLRVQADGKLKELKRTTEPVSTPAETVVSFDGTSIDASEGSEFNYTAASNQVLAEILNGVEGDEIKITGKTGGGNTITVSDSTTIEVASNAVLATDADFIQLIFVDGKWTEFNRTIA